jgi:hypothetical protein
MLLLSVTCVTQIFGKSPVAIEKVASVEELAGDVVSKITEIDELLAGKYDEKSQTSIRQAAGVLACLGQAIAEHPENSKTKIQGAAVRDTAFVLAETKTQDDAKAALPAVKSAVDGSDTGKHEVEHPWNKLIKMHDMMEEVNTRNSKIRRALKRPKGNLEERQHASTIAILCLAMAVDTHEVKDKTKIPEWEKMSFDYQKAMTELSAALAEKNKEKAEELYAAGNKTCDLCHEAFRDN